MSPLNLSWVFGPFPGSGGNIDNPEWTIVAEKLNIAFEAGGGVTLETEDEHELPQCLQVQSENGAYRVTFGHAPFGDWRVLSYKNPEAVDADEPVEIGGYKWKRKCICYDPQDVIAVFAEYFQNQRVPTKLLDPGSS